MRVTIDVKVAVINLGNGKWYMSVAISAFILMVFALLYIVFLRHNSYCLPCEVGCLFT